MPQSSESSLVANQNNFGCGTSNAEGQGQGYLQDKNNESCRGDKANCGEIGEVEGESNNRIDSEQGREEGTRDEELGGEDRNSCQDNERNGSVHMMDVDESFSTPRPIHAGCDGMGEVEGDKTGKSINSEEDKDDDREARTRYEELGEEPELHNSFQDNEQDGSDSVQMDVDEPFLTRRSICNRLERHSEVAISSIKPSTTSSSSGSKKRRREFDEKRTGKTLPKGSPLPPSIIRKKSAKLNSVNPSSMPPIERIDVDLFALSSMWEPDNLDLLVSQIINHLCYGHFADLKTLI